MTQSGLLKRATISWHTWRGITVHLYLLVMQCFSLFNIWSIGLPLMEMCEIFSQKFFEVLRLMFAHKNFGYVFEPILIFIGAPPAHAFKFHG
jgi:hypothetical protein